MKRLLLPLLLVVGLGLSACSGDRMTLAERVTSVNNAITLTAKTATQALNDGYISVRRACQIHKYGTIAGLINDQAWQSYIAGDKVGASDRLEAAREALEGGLPIARETAAEEC